ncbi:hypothetical protein BGZ83_005049 [Gryganskiella cystojenkinii]|nr:hypothetical protein BGZ83_005049 [Gryganskiella cystojenkinii]
MDVCEDNSHRWSTRPFSRATGTFDPFYQLQYQQEQRQRSLQHQQHTTNQILELQEQNRWANSNIDHLSRHMVLLMDKMKEMFPGGTGQDHSSALPSAFHETPNPTLATTTATVTTAPAMYSTSRKPFANFTEQMTGGSGRRIGEERGSAAAMALHTYSAESSLSPPVLHMVPSSNECSVSPPKIPSPSSSGTLSPPISAEILNIMFPLHSEEEEEEDNFSGTPARVQKQKKGWKNLQDRRHSRTLKRKSSAGSILSAGVGTGTAGMSNITAANIPCRPTISLRGPLTAGPSTAGPSTAGSSTVHPSTAGLSTAHPSVTGPSTAAPPTTVPPPPTTVPAPTVRFVMVPSTTNSFAATPSTTLAPAILRSTTALSTVVPSTTVSPTTRHYPASPFNSVINPSSTIASLSTTTGYSPLSGFYSTVPLTSNSTSGASQPTISVQTSHVAVPTSTAAGGVPTTTGLVPPTTPPVTVPSMSPSTSPTSESILEFTSFFDSDYDSDDDPTEVVNRPKPRQKRRRL